MHMERSMVSSQGRRPCTDSWLHLNLVAWSMFVQPCAASSLRQWNAAVVYLSGTCGVIMACVQVYLSDGRWLLALLFPTGLRPFPTSGSSLPHLQVSPGFDAASDVKSG